MGNQSTYNNFKQIFRHFTVPSLTLKNPLSCIVMHQKQTYELLVVKIKTENSHWIKSVQIRRYFCSVSSCIRTRTNSELGHFSRSVKKISCASWTITPLEKKYHLHFGKLEFLTSKWATTAKFSNYLLCGP